MSDSPPPPDESQPGPRSRSGFASIRRKFADAGRASWQHLKRVFAYYRDNRGAFRDYLSEYAVGLRSPRLRQREIRITADDDNPATWYSNDGWHVNLPDCCAACGDAGHGDWIDREYSVPRVTWSFWAPIAGFGLGFVAMLAAQWFWLWPIGTLLGFLYGYDCREHESAVVRYRLCERHTNVKRVPYLRIFDDLLIVRVGHSSIKQKFIQDRHGGSGKLFTSTIDEPAVAEDLGPIPLAESDDEMTIQHDERERMAGYPGDAEFIAGPPGDAESGASPPAKLREHQPDAQLPSDEPWDENADEQSAGERTDDEHSSATAGNGHGSSAPEISESTTETRHCPHCGAEVGTDDTLCLECDGEL